jgi:hypothetical protein
MEQIHYIHVDSKSRDSNLYPYGNSYVLHIVSPIKNVKSIDLVSAKIPNSMYNITDGTNVITTDSLSISINTGFYSAQLLESEIATRLNIREGIKYLQAEGKFIYLTNEPDKTFIVNTNEIAKILGLVKDKVYTVQSLDVPINGFSYGVKSERVIDLSLNEYVFLDIEEFRTPFFEDAKSLPLSGSSARNMFAVIPMDVPSTHVKTFKENTDFFTQVDIPIQTLSRLTIRWYDKDLNLLNFQGFENNAFIIRIHSKISIDEKEEEKQSGHKKIITKPTIHTLFIFMVVVFVILTFYRTK